MILLKDAADAKKICINWGSQFLTAMFTITFKTTFIIKKKCVNGLHYTVY